MNYAHPKPNGEFQFLLCLVVAGDTVRLGGDNQRRMPPNAPDQRPYDSVSSQDGSHVIVYDFNKQFPCYLVTYR